MKLSEGLLLAATFPLCRRTWKEGEAGCLLTALGKAVGVDINSGDYLGDVSLLEAHFPLLFQAVSHSDLYGPPMVFECIVAMFDGTTRAYRQHTVDEIVAWVQELEAAQEAAQEEVHELQKG